MGAQDTMGQEPAAPEPGNAAGPSTELGLLGWRWLWQDLRLFWARFSVARRWFRQRYMLADPRTIGLYRIVLGLLLCVDCIRHWREARLFYSNDGVLSNHFHLFHPSGGFNFSVFHAFSTPEEVHVAFALCFLCYFFFLVGYRARLFSILACIWATSMDNRLVLVENGGYVVVNLMIFWAMFMPTGQRFSIDSLRRSFKERREQSIEALNARVRPSWLDQQYHSLIAAMVVLNLAVVYLFNVINKYGTVWRSGETVHHVLHLDRMVTGVAVFFRDYLPYEGMVVASHAVLVVESMILMSIVWPNQRLRARPLAMMLMSGLHGAFGVMMRLGPFSWFIIGWSTLLLQKAHWQALKRWYAGDKAPLTVHCDISQGSSLFFGRMLSRLDRCELLHFALLPDVGDHLFAVQQPPAQQQLDRDHSGATAAQVIVGRAALWTIVAALPAGRVFGKMARIFSLGLLDLIAALTDRAGTRLTRLFALPAAKPPPADAAAARATDDSATAADSTSALAELPRLLRYRAKATRALRELMLSWLIACSLSQLINENKSIPEPIKHVQPMWMQATLQYPRIFQGWGMFSPNPIQEDGSVTVDAWTIGGRHVDPFTGQTPDLLLSDARGLGLNQIRQDYFNRIRLDHNKGFRMALQRHLNKWHTITGNSNDELIAFDVYWVRDHNPEPRSTETSDPNTICILSWRKPHFRPKAGTPRPPRPCKVRSAGK